MTEIVVPKRRFALLRRSLREHMPGFYGWMLGSAVLRRVFSVIKGEQKIVVEGDAAQRFTAIYESHFWVDDQSRSGGGSNLYATEKIREAIPGLFLKFGVRSVLDIPCGDFFWFKEMKLELDSYIGGDIVVPLILKRNAGLAGAASDAGAQLLTTHRIAIFVILFLAYIYYRSAGEAQLAAIGFLSMAAVAQFATSYICDI